MKRLQSAINAELIKIINYRTFWVLTGLYILTLIVVLFGIQAFLNNVTVNINNKSPLPVPSITVYAFPMVWQNLAYVAGYLKVFPAFLIIILITNEFSFSTLKQQLITGTSRAIYLSAKIILIACFSIAIALTVGLCGLVAGLLQPTPDYSKIINPGLWFIGAHAFEIFSYLIFTAFIAIIFKRAGISVILLMLYTLVIEKILVFRLPESLGQKLPLESIGNLIPLPNSPLMKLFGVSFRNHTAWQDIASCLIYNLIFIALMYLILRKKDL
ncbi:MAG: ABC transporter permease [Lentimicrobium sp.]|nr:ABC transporter permease [Lentimicrobium sp.]